MTLTYADFLRSKITTAERTGFEIDPGSLPADNKPHQTAAVVWAAHLPAD